MKSPQSRFSPSDFLAAPHLDGGFLFIFKNYESLERNWEVIGLRHDSTNLPTRVMEKIQLALRGEREAWTRKQNKKKNLEVGSGFKFSIRTLKIDACGYRNGSVLLLDKPQEADAWAVEMNSIF